MKKLLSILGTIGLTATSTTSLISCNKENNKPELPNKQQPPEGSNWKQVIAQDEPFNKIDNKWYVVIWRADKNDDWIITKFKNDKKVDNLIKITNINNWSLCLNKDIPYDIKDNKNVILFIVEDEKQGKIKQNNNIWQKTNDDYFKSVYRWDGVGEPQLPTINKNTGEITDWKEQKGTVIKFLFVLFSQ